MELLLAANGSPLGSRRITNQPINLYFVTRTNLRRTNVLCSLTIAWNSCEEDDVVILSNHHSSIFLLDFIRLFLRNGKSLEKIEIMQKTRKLNLKKLYALQAVCIDNCDVVEPDYDLRETEDSSIEMTQENREAAEISKLRAMDAILELPGNPNEVVEHLTEATKLNPKSAILHASRVADAALEINPDLAKGYKARGMARVLLGLWDHCDAQKAFQVAANVKKLEEHRLKYERLKEEALLARDEGNVPKQNRHFYLQRKTPR